ncbi:type II toxin-antitoxin system MqsA family antitoxin [Pantoea sp. Lij88]|jgi:HTH-type transcriptional regulator/antitoxin MqsA|uniref:type II toxin-antitoxin system MqsA family antitoxin n=1 Tax=Pantoea sp. Lij88 TaxID=3028622 RepID=UPI0024B8CBCB|nr:type II toxin-antitoxin system MqsA family antitoxin [Pantoea sp. Lij88]WHQ73825.1 type II toxin-antitoxin system MqsA family antitoxin [Pantoea sp. Lij88]
MKCPGCEGEAFVYATRDVSLNTGNPDDVVPDVKGDHCIRCGAVIMNAGTAEHYPEKAEALENAGVPVK